MIVRLTTHGEGDLRSLVVFLALFFAGLVAGIAFVIWIEYNATGMTSSVYTAAMQHAIAVFTMPLPAVVMASVISSAAYAISMRRDHATFYLLVLATACAAAVALITVLGNVPINNQIKLWDPSAPPQNWADVAGRWWRFQTVRTGAALLGFAAVIVAAIRRQGRF